MDNGAHHHVIWSKYCPLADCSGSYLESFRGVLKCALLDAIILLCAASHTLACTVQRLPKPALIPCKKIA